MPNAEKLKGFVDWCSEHVAGDEKGEAQIFLDHLFQAIGYNGGLKEAGATLEERVSKADSGGTAFLRPGDLTPIVGNDHVAVTRDAADQLAGVFRRLVAPARTPPWTAPPRRSSSSRCSSRSSPRTSDCSTSISSPSCWKTARARPTATISSSARSSKNLIAMLYFTAGRLDLPATR